LTLLVAALAGTGLSLRLQVERQQWVEHTLAVRTCLLQTLATVQDAETGQRGFALSGDRGFLEPFKAAQQKLDARLQELRQEVLDNPVQVERTGRLRSIAEAQIAALNESVRDGTGAPASLERLRDDKRRMDEARGVIAEMMDEEDRLLRGRNAETHLAITTTQVGGYLALLLAGLVGWANIRDRQRQVADLRAANVALEDALAKVEEESERRERLEAQFRQAQKMEAVGQLTGGIAHDFNNMLAVIGGCLNLIRRKITRGEGDMEPLIDKANDCVDRTAKLTHSLLAFSRQQPLAPQIVDVNKLVGNMSELMLRTLGSNLKVETVLASGLWRTRVDPNQLESALLNLAVNARDAMPDGGTLTIETGNASIDEEYVRQHVEVQAGQYVLVAVTDSGQGMPPEVAAKAFDPFFTTKAPGKGTGLGLSQVFGFVKQSSGHIKIYSEVGVGTTVKIYLPRHMAEGDVALPDRRGIFEAPHRGSPDTLILVVEDDERMRGVAVEMVRELGYGALAAENATHALSLIDANPAIAVLFTDIVMPDVNGRQLAEEALRRRPGLAVIFTTGFTRNAVIHQGVLDPGVNFLPKPFSIEQLGRMFVTALGEDAPEGHR
jgi:signal transduction histidine kinase/ActR/RegA family two-component response regulator